MYFSAFLSHFQKSVFEKGLFRQFQRFALLAGEWYIEKPSVSPRLVGFAFRTYTHPILAAVILEATRD